MKIDIQIAPNPHNARYLRTKAIRAGHYIDLDGDALAGTIA